MECRLGVKVAALAGEAVLLVNVIANILQYLAQVLPTRYCGCTFLLALSYVAHKQTDYDMPYPKFQNTYIFNLRSSGAW